MFKAFTHNHIFVCESLGVRIFKFEPQNHEACVQQADQIPRTMRALSDLSPEAEARWHFEKTCRHVGLWCAFAFVRFLVSSILRCVSSCSLECQ